MAPAVGQNRRLRMSAFEAFLEVWRYPNLRSNRVRGCGRADPSLSRALAASIIHVRRTESAGTQPEPSDGDSGHDQVLLQPGTHPDEGGAVPRRGRPAVRAGAG